MKSRLKKFKSNYIFYLHYFCKRLIKKNQIILNQSNLIQGIVFFVFWYVVLSLIFLIPSVIIGIASGKMLSITDSKMFL